MLHRLQTKKIHTRHVQGRKTDQGIHENICGGREMNWETLPRFTEEDEKLTFVQEPKVCNDSEVS